MRARERLRGQRSFPSLWPGVVDFFPVAGMVVSAGDFAIMTGVAVSGAGAVRAIVRFREAPPAVALACRLIWGE